MSYFGMTEFLIEVQKGLVPGHSLIHKFGRNDAVPNGSWAMVTLLGQTANAHFLAAGTTVRVKAGGNPADTAAGAGAQDVKILGLDNAGAEINETVATAGAGASASTTASFMRVFRAHVVNVGAYTVGNTGAITIENTAGTQDLIKIAAGEGQTQYCAYTVPAGYTGYVVSVNANVDGLKPADLRLMMRDNFIDVATPYSPIRIVEHWNGVTGTHPHLQRVPLKLLENTDIWMEAYGGGAATEVSCDMQILLVAN